MKLPERLLGSVLEDGTISMEDRVSAALSILESRESIPHAVGKASCFLAYRHLEGRTTDVIEVHQMVSLLNTAREYICEKETDPSSKARWDLSITMALAYVLISCGKFSEARGEMSQQRWGEYIELNPTSAVNICRMMTLCEAMNFGRTQPVKYADDCFALFRQAAQVWHLNNIAECSGRELVLTANAVHISVMLAPFTGRSFLGGVPLVEAVVNAAIGDNFRTALRKIIWHSETIQP